MSIICKMYPMSSQKKNWTFENEIELADMRHKRTQDFIETHGKDMDVSDAKFNGY